MKRKNSLPELLAPAGDFECLLAAVAAGADAVYVGGKRFGARAYAKNFDIDELSRAVSYCHLHGVKLYVTLNTLIEDSELADAVEYAAELYNVGIDALIIADIGAIREIRRLVPGLELHASTQMSVHSTLGADAAWELGCSRVVLARELSLSNIRSVTERARAEVEVFMHGALCVCHSGQCLFSSLVGGRSGNRGECAQPCRLPYNNGKYPLSLKDLSLASHIDELISSGVASLKIEGRMKSPSYVYTVVSIYRKLLDEHRSATPDEHERLRRAFSRGGFTDGYFDGNVRSAMTGVRSEADKSDSRADEHAEFTPTRVRVKASVTLRLGEPSSMTLTDGARSATAYGDAPESAKSAPLDSTGVCARLAKMGNTFLDLSPSDIELTLDEGINLSPARLNALRRSAALAFSGVTRSELSVERLDYVARAKESRAHYRSVSAQFMSEELFLSLGEALEKFDITFIPVNSSDAALSRSNGVYLPPVIFDSEEQVVRAALEKAKKLGATYALVGNIGHIRLALDFGLKPIGDFRLNVTNAESRKAYIDMGVSETLVSAELTLPKARDVSGGVITYGRIPLMITERCFIRENFGCDSCGKASLTDRRGEKFPMLREYDHRNLILNCAVTYMGDKRRELEKYRISHEHFIFTVESPKEAKDVISSYFKEKSLGGSVRRVGRRDADQK
ncbi:MAG: U32 family peptidase [Clostridia bacterium]|nr:U32 family peptidase [Clostridia bacterium]